MKRLLAGETLSDAGPLSPSDRVALNVLPHGARVPPIYVAETDAEAREQARAAYDLYVPTRLYAKQHTYDDIIANGICLMGSVANLADKLCRLYAMGIRHVATMHNFAALQPAPVERSMTLFARGDAGGGAAPGWEGSGGR